ncbi:MAG: hypothetical protein ABI759_01680 [Candidatus Solibacter sp.]
MTITYSYLSGRTVVARVLLIGAGFIRVAAPHRAAGQDIHLRDEDWVTDSGTVIRVDAIVLGEGACIPRAVTEKRKNSKRKRLKVLTAGGAWS